MRTRIAVAGLLAGISSGKLLAQAEKARMPVAIRLIGDDALTQSLNHGLDEAAAHSSLVRLANLDEQALISVESDSNVTPDTLGGRSVMIYSVRVAKRNSMVVPVTGVCYEHAVSKCVAAIMRVVERQASWNGN